MRGALRQRVVPHELGHAVGLAHLSYGPEYEKRAVMLGTILSNDPDGPSGLYVSAWERRWLDERFWTVYP
jgi:hypothetical protein